MNYETKNVLNFAYKFHWSKLLITIYMNFPNISMIGNFFKNDTQKQMLVLRILKLENL